MVKSLSLKIGVSGVRGVVGESLTPQLVTSFAAAFGTYCGRGRIVIGTDTRPSREMVAQATIAGLLSVGCTPVLLDIVPAPTLQLYVRQTDAVGGICVTASHNPIDWNALKFFGADGIALRPNQFSELLDLYHQGVFARVDTDNMQDVDFEDAAPDRHRDAILEHIDADLIRKQAFHVVVDCCNGAAAKTAPEFLRTLGCEVSELDTSLDAKFSRNPEPLPEHIGALKDRVREEGADAGFALDADADRLSIVDEFGDALGEDLTIALAARHVLSSQPGPVVVNGSTSRVVDDVAKEFGVEVHRSSVGEINVLERMLECGSTIGGEGNGGVILPAVNPCRDSFVAMALILESLALNDTTLSASCDSLPRYAMIKQKIPFLRRHVAATLRLLEHFFRGENIDRTDGVKVTWDDRWLQVRISNTEPVLRICAEAPTESAARELVRGVVEYLRPRR